MSCGGKADNRTLSPVQHEGHRRPPQEKVSVSMAI